MLTATTISQKPYTFAKVTSGDLTVGVGFAKCNPTDQWDQELGERIAIGRAIKQAERNTAARVCLSTYVVPDYPRKHTTLELSSA